MCKQKIRCEHDTRASGFLKASDQVKELLPSVSGDGNDRFFIPSHDDHALSFVFSDA